MKAMLLGMTPEVGTDNFADTEPIEILPYKEALTYTRKKLPVDAETYYALDDKMRYRAFAVSRLADGDAVRCVQSMLADAMEEGKSLSQFLQMTEGDLADAAGMGRGAGWYYETVFRTNTATAYNVGRAIGYEEVPPIALELIGIDDTRQTEICHSLTVPPFRRPYGDSVWEHLWPPFHFNCRTTVRAIYDESEIEEAGGPDAFYSKSAPDFAPAEGFGAYPVDKTDTWWNLTDAMQERAGKYGLEAEFMEAREKLIEGNKSDLQFDEEKIVETLHKVEESIKDLDYEEGAIVRLDGKNIWTGKGGRHSVDPPSNLVKDNIFTHNHPSGNCALSTGDVINIVKDDGYGVRAVTQDGRFVYLKKGGGELYGSKMAEDFRKEFPDDSTLFKKAAEEATRIHGRVRNTQLILNEAENIVNKWFVDNAGKYGYVFTQGKI